MLSQNEWDPLIHVVVGRADHARIPSMDLSLRTVNYSHLADVSALPNGPYPESVINEANEDLEGMVKVFKDLHVKVDRPSLEILPEYYYYCPRDTICVFADTVIEAPMPLRVRRDENQAYRHIFDQSTESFTWLRLNSQRQDRLYNKNCIQNPDVLALAEIEASFDAANILRANRDIFYLVSNSGNKAGADLLQRLLGTEYRVWPIENVYSYMHIDSTIALLREGLMLLNPSRIKSVDQLPLPLQSWDVIWAPDPGEKWHYPGICNSSRWVTINVFSPSPDLCLIEHDQTELAKLLEQNRITPVLLPIRHSRTLGGGFHCCTLDIKRNHD
jgi:glycine amidinotransferase/scyllo-inosamine-4-phosphate amidinotransferase 1